MCLNVWATLYGGNSSCSKSQDYVHWKEKNVYEKIVWINDIV